MYTPYKCINMDNLNKRMDELCDMISFDKTNVANTVNTENKSINKTIVLYSLSNESLIKDLNLNENDNIVIRTCRSNIESKRKLINIHKGSTITITAYREYIYIYI